MNSRYVCLAKRPNNLIEARDFSIRSEPLDERSDTLVQNCFLSVDAGLRLLLGSAPPGAVPIEVGHAMFGPAVGRVVHSADPTLRNDSLVVHGLGWRDYSSGSSAEFTPVQELPGLSPSVYLGALGMPGFAAWFGLTKLAQVRPGETVLVTAAAGGVGTIAGQIAKYAGAGTVIGSTSNLAKAKFLHEQLGFDAVIPYNHVSFAERLAELAPSGIDVLFDSVSGEQYIEALRQMKTGGRIVQNGALALYQSYKCSPHDTVIVTHRGLTIHGLFAPAIIDTYRNEFTADILGLLEDGTLRAVESIRGGLEAMPGSFVDLFQGRNLGKALIQLSTEP